jgi:hypothetical protein
MKDSVRAFRLCEAERIFLHGVMNQAIAKAEKQDIRVCVKYAMRLLHHDTHVRARAKGVLRHAILEAFEDRGPAMFRKLFERSNTFKMLPKPLKGNQLQAEARRFNILQRSRQARVGAAVIREECALAPIRLKMNMPEEVGRECKRVTMLKTKRKECIKRIVEHAKATGVADITQVWRDFHDAPTSLVEVALAAIATVAKLPDVHVLDIHAQTHLFAFPIFAKVLHLLNPSYIFAINLGEDAQTFETRHFQLLAGKISDGTIALRRWFVESNPQRRCTLVKCGLVTKAPTKRYPNPKVTHPNVFTIARRADRTLWHEGNRKNTRLARLLAAESAFVGASLYKTDMQNTTCNWGKACDLRATRADKANMTCACNYTD